MNCWMNSSKSLHYGKRRCFFHFAFSPQTFSSEKKPSRLDLTKKKRDLRAQIHCEYLPRSKDQDKPASHKSRRLHDNPASAIYPHTLFIYFPPFFARIKDFFSRARARAMSDVFPPSVSVGEWVWRVNYIHPPDPIYLWSLLTAGFLLSGSEDDAATSGP